MHIDDASCFRFWAQTCHSFRALAIPVSAASVLRQLFMEGLRRLRRKTTIGALAVGLLLAPAAAAAQVLAPVRQQRFLDEEDLQDEDAAKKKAVYLVTLPHPRRSAGEGAAADLKRPGHCVACG